MPAFPASEVPTEAFAVFRPIQGKIWGKLLFWLLLMLATVLRRNLSKNIVDLEITVSKEMQLTSKMKVFLRGMLFIRMSISLVINPFRATVLW